MSCLLLNSSILICIFVTVLLTATDSLKANNETRSVKKDLEGVRIRTAETGLPLHEKIPTQTTAMNVEPRERNSFEDIKEQVFHSQFSVETEIPEFVKMGFYFFIGLSMTAITFILIKIYRMRQSRAERKYGVHSDRTTQELTPLPLATEDDSGNEDHTLFDINRQIRVS